MTDIQLNDDFEMVIENGDIVIGESAQQHVNCIFIAHPGHFKESPVTGFGASNYLKKTTQAKPKFYRNLSIQLELDGFVNPDISNDLNNLIIKV